MTIVVAHRLRPHPGFIENGDGLAVRERDGASLILVVDGVGHGRHAAQACEAAMTFFAGSATSDLSDLLAGCNAALAETRGAVAALVRIPHDRPTLSYVGVGNIGGYLWTPDRLRGLINHNGIVGRLTRVPNPKEYETVDHHLLLLHSDGIPTRVIRPEMARWDGDLESQAERLMARAVVRDDAVVLLAQIRFPRPVPNGMAGA